MTKNSFILNHKVVGKGNPIVFLHGFLENLKMWEEILPKLPSIQAICIDLPGHGDSPLHYSELSLSLITEAVKSTLESLEINKFSIVGHSLGGYVALHLAEDLSLEIEDIVLLHSHPWADDEEKKKNRTRTAKIVAYNKSLFIAEAIPALYFEGHRKEFAREIQLGIEEANKMEAEAIIQALYSMRDREDKTNILKRWKDKLHIIQGEFDHLIDTQSIQKLALASNNNFHLIKDIGHMGHEEATKQVIELLSFLDKKGD